MKHAQLTEELRESAMLYAAGALEENERREFARHLDEDGCAVCRAEVREFESAAQLLVMDLKEQAPSESVKKRLMAQAEAVAGRAQARGERKPSGAFAWFGWVTAAASVVTVLFVLNLNSSLRDEVGSLNSRVVELEGEMTQQRLQLASLTSPDVRVVNLAGQGTTPGARARIFWNESERRWRLYVRGLPKTSSDRSYQLWFVPASGNPVSASVFTTGPDGSAEIEIAVPGDLAMLKAAAVTDEPAGGRPQPTGGFVLLGAI